MSIQFHRMPSEEVEPRGGQTVTTTKKIKTVTKDELPDTSLTSGWKHQAKPVSEKETKQNQFIKN